jgi:hypothetical protein
MYDKEINGVINAFVLRYIHDVFSCSHCEYNREHISMKVDSKVKTDIVKHQVMEYTFTFYINGKMQFAKVSLVLPEKDIQKAIKKELKKEIFNNIETMMKIVKIL